MYIRPSHVADIDRIMEILADGRASIGALGIDQWQKGYPHRDVVERDVANGESYVVVDENDRALATAMMSPAGEPDYDCIYDGAWLVDAPSEEPHYLVVHRVAVASECKGRGLASALLAKAAELAEVMGKESVRIDTHPGNEPMRRMVQKNGFQECGIIHISHAEDGIPQRVAYEKLVIPECVEF
ncbi:MAG: GNAT family N-acetyltransferase [Eggerthellaceae bacterium]|nr:GNAT family N-acetyltransferase [Eggerthellaceae bacterium]